MIDTFQLLIISAVIVMTVLLTIISVQLVFVLKDLRKFLVNANQIIEEFNKVGTGLTSGYHELVGFISGVKKIIEVIDFTTKKRHKDNEK